MKFQNLSVKRLFGRVAMGLVLSMSGITIVLFFVTKQTAVLLTGGALLLCLALVLQFRGRIAVALVVALWLGVAQAWPRLQQWPRHAGLQAVGQMSYSVFLIHFPVCLLVNAVVSHLWPTQPLVNLLGMLVAFGLSLLAGAVLYRCVEARPVSVPKLLGIQAGLVVVGLVA